jgi:hypothetical protein
VTDAQAYNIASIRQFLLAAFTASELRRFCQDRETFRPLLHEFSPSDGLADMIDEIIDYCQTRLLWDEFLAGVQEVNPEQYARFAPQMGGPGAPGKPSPDSVRTLHPLGAPPGTTPPGPVHNRWALLAGINHYVDPAFPPLRFCISDVLALEGLLCARGYTTVVLHDEAPEERLLPTRDNVEAELARLCGVAGADDLLWVHFAGHGKLADGQAVLVTREMRAPTLAEKALPLSEVERRMRDSRARRLVLTLDACHTGVEIGRDLSDPEFMANAYELAEGFALLAGSTAQQVAQEWEEKAHGVFTYYLLEGLSGQADHGGKGFVTVDDIKTYVLDSLRRWNVAYGGLLQEPTARTEGLGDMILVAEP